MPLGLAYTQVRDAGNSLEPTSMTLRAIYPWSVALALTALASPALAIPPIVSGDIPTANKGVYELFVGHLFVRADRGEEHQIPFWELVYGLSRRQELTLEAPLLYRRAGGTGIVGFGDVVLGTKVRLLGAPEADEGLSASLEVSLPTGERQRGLGPGVVDVDLRARGGWEIGREVVYFNLGHTWRRDGPGSPRDDTWFYSGVWDHPLGRRLQLLTEVYGRTAGAPGDPDRVAATIGIKWRVRARQQLHFSIGRSLRSGAEGGPRLRVYTGWRWDF